MTQFAAINLQTLNYTRASDGKGNSKPYIWPAVVWIDGTGVHVTSPAVQFSEELIANGMHAGDTEGIPVSVGELSAQIGDGFLGLVLVAALWDQRDTPSNVVQSGFQAFPSALQAAIQDNLAALSDPNQRAAAVAAVKTSVNGKVSSAIENALTWYQKVEIFLGTMHLDSNIGSDFSFLQQLVPSTVALDIVQQVGTAANEYKVSGNVQLFPTQISFPAFLGFGKLPVGEPSNPGSLIIANTGTAAATVSIPPSPHVHANFTWDASGNRTINPGGSLTLRVVFTPTVIGLNEGQLHFTSNAVGSPHVVTLSGQGVRGEPR
jgi:Abnormal spindle-like microcephaly-assoc'd, ASPM-SPD-2-Hydin